MAVTMKAIGSFAGGLDDPNSVRDVTVDVPELRPHDIHVRVQAVSVNPADVKRHRAATNVDEPLILGYDATGVVEKIGSQVSTLSKGDEVWYAGDISRPGTNADLHAVDERIVARKPTSLSFTDAAALPLTTITAWESLFERFELTVESTGDLVVLAAAGGVGSVMIQLAKALTKLRVIATASREDTRQWVLAQGADEVINHHDLRAEATRVCPAGVDYLFSPFSAGNIEIFADIMRPLGHIAAIDEPEGMDLVPLKAKSIAWHWELMFTKALFGYDMISQQRLLTKAADLVDAGTITATLTETINGFNADGIREALRAVGTGKMIGKVVVTR